MKSCQLQLQKIMLPRSSAERRHVSMRTQRWSRDTSPMFTHLFWTSYLQRQEMLLRYEMTWNDLRSCFSCLIQMIGVFISFNIFDQSFLPGTQWTNRRQKDWHCVLWASGLKTFQMSSGDSRGTPFPLPGTRMSWLCLRFGGHAAELLESKRSFGCQTLSLSLAAN